MCESMCIAVVVAEPLSNDGGGHLDVAPMTLNGIISLARISSGWGSGLCFV